MTSPDRALRQVLGVADVTGSNISGDTTLPVSLLLRPMSRRKRLRRRIWESSISTCSSIKRPGVLPLRAGAVFQDGSHRLMIDDVQSLPRGPVFGCKRQARPAPWPVVHRRHIPTFLRNRSQLVKCSRGRCGHGAIPPNPGKFVSGRHGLLGSPFGFTSGSGHLNFPSTASGANSESALVRTAAMTGPTTNGYKERNSSSSKWWIPALSSGDSS